MVTHPSTNRDQRRLTWLIETNALPLRQIATNSGVVRRDVWVTPPPLAGVDKTHWRPNLQDDVVVVKHTVGHP